MKETVKTEQDIKKKVNAPLLGIIYKERKRGVKLFARRNKGLLISKFTISFGFIEAVKKLRNRVEYMAKTNGGKIIMVTSVMENEGKTTVAANLALALAQKGKRVLLVDGDLRKPALYKILEQKLTPKQQFGEVLRKKITVSDALIQDKNTSLLMLLGSKCYEHSSEMIGEKQFAEIIQKSSKLVDYVIIDSPPLAYLPDAESMAGCVDGIVLTVRQNQCRITQINDALDSLSQGSAKVYGCVLNQVRSYGSLAGGYGGHYGYAYGYGRHGRREDRED